MILVVDWSVGLVGLGASLAINAYRTLKLLELSFTMLMGDNDYPLYGLSRELRLSLGTTFLKSLNWT